MSVARLIFAGGGSYNGNLHTGLASSKQPSQESVELSGGRKYWIGFGISAVLLAAFFLTVDIGRLGEELAGANYVYLVPAVALYLVSVGFRTLRWKWLLRHIKQIGWLRLYPVVVVGYMANNLLPMRLGELVRSYYVGEREGISKVSALVTIFVERLLDALTLLLFIAAIALFVPLAGLAEGFAERSGVPWPLLATALSVPFVAAFAVLLLLALSPSRAQALAIAVIRLLPHRFQARLQDMLETFLHGLVPLRSPGTIAVLFLLTVPIWLFEAGLFFVLGFSFDLHNMYDSPGEMAIALVLVTAIANIGSSVPAAPGGVGLFELVARETLVLLPLAAIDRAVAAGYVAVVHIALLLPMIALGQLFLWTEQLSLRRLSRAGQEFGGPRPDGLASAEMPGDGEKVE